MLIVYSYLFYILEFTTTQFLFDNSCLEEVGFILYVGLIFSAAVYLRAVCLFLVLLWKRCYLVVLFAREYEDKNLVFLNQSVVPLGTRCLVWLIENKSKFYWDFFVYITSLLSWIINYSQFIFWIYTAEPFIFQELHISCTVMTLYISCCNPE